MVPLGWGRCFRPFVGVDVFASYRLFKGEGEDGSEDSGSES